MTLTLNKDKTIRILKIIVRLLLGAFFVATAVLKLLSLDNFEIYIYSFNLFGYTLCAVVARLVIAAELVLGLLLATRIFYKPAWWLTMAMMTGFTLLLVYAALFRSDANCHCMGDLVQMRPSVSIVKNLITILLLLLVRNEKELVFKRKRLVGIAILAVSILVPFALFPTNAVYKLFSGGKDNINKEAFETFMQDSTIRTLQIDNGRHLVGYLAAGCKYCKTGGAKLNSIVEKHHLNTGKVTFFIWGDEEAIQTYKAETGADKFRYQPVNPVMAVQLVGGEFPTFLMLQDGNIVDILDIRRLDEQTITQFLNNEPIN